MTTDKDSTINPERMPLTVKGRTMAQEYRAGKMGPSVPLTTQEFFKDVRKPFIRSSPVMALDHCPRKFLYECRLGITPRRYESALTMGTIVHKILQSLFMGQEPEEALQVCKCLLAKEQARLVEDAGPDGFLPTGEALEATLKKVEEDYHKARAIGFVFWQFVPFAKDEYEVLRTPWDTPMVEVLLTTKIKGLSRPILTPVDLALVEKATGDVFIVDYKTTSFDPRKRAIPTKISVQLALYRAGLQDHLDQWHRDGLAPKRMVVGSIHAIIKKPGIKCCGKDEKQAQKDGTDAFTAYIKRLVQWYKDEEAKDTQNPPLILDPNRFSGPTISREMWGRLKQYGKACHAAPNPDAFYRVGESACLQYNKICPYMVLCNSDPAMWPDLVRQRFEISFREDREKNNGEG